MVNSTQNLIKAVLEQVPIYASAIAAICAAYAAYKSWAVSQNSLNLQKAYFQNQDAILKVNSIIEKLENLSIYIIRNPLELADNELEQGEVLLNQIKRSFSSLRVAAIEKAYIPNIDKLSSLVDIYEEYNKNPMYIEKLVIQLKKYRNTILIS